jgi:hypothetical protein
MEASNAEFQTLVKDQRDQAILDRVWSEIVDFFQKQEDLDKRAEALELVHEEGIIVEKINLQDLSTSLLTPSRGRNDQYRLSYYGRVIRVSEVGTGDDVKDLKKRKVSKGDYIIFNPEAAWSLNINFPQEFPEIWLLSIENILVVDKAFKPIEIKKQSLVRLLERD